MASSSVLSNLGNVVVVNHVVSAPATVEQQQFLERGLRFRRGQPAALGTVQVMIGVIVLVFTIAMAVLQPTLGLYSGIFVWGSLIYMTTGFVTVAAEKYLSRCLIIACLVLNIVATIIAVIGIVLYALDGSVWYNMHGYISDYYRGFSVLLAVFQLLLLIISIAMSAFSCSAMCSCCRETHVLVQTSDGAFAAQTPAQFNTGPMAPSQPRPQVGPHYKSQNPSSTEPPAYELTP